VVESCADKKQHQFEREVEKHSADLLRVVAGLYRAHDAIDNQLAYPGLRGWEQRSEQRQNAKP
jgi:hypothetical protein